MKYGVDYIGIFAAAVCFDAEGNFLMGKRGGQARDCHGMWEFPGGQIEIGEPAEEALKREFQEECGAELSNIILVEVKEFLEGGRHHYGFYYAADIDRDSVQLVEPVYDKFDWFTPETIPKEVRGDYYFDIARKALLGRK